MLKELSRFRSQIRPALGLQCRSCPRASLGWRVSGFFFCFVCLSRLLSLAVFGLPCCSNPRFKKLVQKFKFKYNPSRIIGLQTPRNQSQSKKFQNSAIRRYIEFNTAVRKQKGYAELFESRQARSPWASRSGSRISSPRAKSPSRSALGKPIGSSAQRRLRRAETPVKSATMQTGAGKNMAWTPKAKHAINKQTGHSSYLFKFLKHVESGAKAGSSPALPKNHRNRSGSVHKQFTSGFAPRLTHESYVEILSRSLERKNELSRASKAPPKNKKKRRKIRRRPR